MPLPGEVAQFEMAPVERAKNFDTMDIAARNPREAAVIGLFYPSLTKEAMLVLILRKTYKGVHSNQVGFPGGKWETYDGSIEATALRETEEEIGVPRDRISLVKKMTRVYIPPSNFWVQPFMGFTEYTPEFVPEEAEVEAILEVRVTDFLSEESLVVKKITTSYAKDLDVPAFLLNKNVVWGATAMMLSEMKNMLMKTE
ncbi:CoA pyrophosphatase [Flavimarina sp. Hel_I_48]|uniref:NUDIX hydrolase n=1 Tax=Flavimarina sp. Hel_I_48 TaxID=1392488 RepID=UPI0029348823|nr:CoA pyrophosphatase [Flavimarina sp. Hel_I_48]